MAPRVISLTAEPVWSGNDGTWSTFAIKVGTPSVQISVYPATSGRSTWVVNPLGCPELPGDSSLCTRLRGGIFDPNKSATWSNVSATDEYLYLNFAAQEALNSALPQGLNYSGVSIPGTDVLSLGNDSSDIQLVNTVIASYEDKIPFLGVIGLSALNETVTNETDTYYSVLRSLVAAGHVTGQYWGYTAGASYRQADGAVEIRNAASLTFGGYDASRANPNNTVTVPLALSNSGKSLGVAIQNIVLRTGGSNRNVFTNPIVAQIDSVVPEIWLPEAACQVFEEAFGLIWNETAKYYFVDDQKHDELTRGNASVSFVLTPDLVSLETTTITLPYSALQPMAGWPLLSNLTDSQVLRLRYFPVRRSQNEDQYYLGRTFLQETYLAVDYDNSQLHLSPARFPTVTTEEDLRFPNGTVAAPPSSTETRIATKSISLSGGAMAGVVIGVLASLGIIIVAILSMRRCRTRKTQQKNHQRLYGAGSTVARKPELDGTGIAEASGQDQKPELHSTAIAEMQGGDLDGFTSELEGAGRVELSRGESQEHFRFELDAREQQRSL